MVIVCENIYLNSTWTWFLSLEIYKNNLVMEAKQTKLQQKPESSRKVLKQARET